MSRTPRRSSTTSIASTSRRATRFKLNNENDAIENKMNEIAIENKMDEITIEDEIAIENEMAIEDEIAIKNEMMNKSNGQTETYMNK